MSINLIIEAPHLNNKRPHLVTGAMSIAKKIVKQLLIRNASGNNAVISGIDKQRFEAQKNHLFPGVQTDLYHYHNAFQAFLTRSGLTTAFIPGLAMTKLLNIRNSLACHIPVCGLVHNISQPKHFDMLASIAKTATEIDSLICPSASTKKIIEAYFQLHQIQAKLQLPVIPYGVALNQFQPVISKKELRRKYYIPESKTVILHVSRINPFTKMDIIPTIRNFETVHRDFPDTLLLIVGQPHSDDYFCQLKQYVKTQKISHAVQFISNVRHDAMEDYYQLADIFISLSDNMTENFGISVIEAMACGLPCITSDIAGHKDIIANKKEGFVIPVISSPYLDLDFHFNTLPVSDYGDTAIQIIALDNKHVQNSLATLIQDTDMRAQMSLNARKRAVQFYSQEKMIDSYEALFESIIEKASALPITDFPELPYHYIVDIYAHSLPNKLTEESKLQLTPSGKSAAKKGHLPPLFEKHLDFFQLIPFIIKALHRKKQSLEDLQKVISGTDLSTLSMNVLYLLEHDLIEIAG